MANIGIHTGITDAIGGTQLMELLPLSAATGSRILAKLEQTSVGGSVKDRPALQMIVDAEQQGLLQRGGLVVEATGGNTGVALAMICRSRGYRCTLTVPCNISEEKILLARRLGAEVVPCPLVSFSDTEQHFFHVAKRISQENNGFFCNQFDNESNWKSHYRTTGPEIWSQCGQQLDAFVCSAGTGGTISGISQFLTERDPAIQCFLADPLSSGLHSYLQDGEFVCGGTSHTEGIGILRLTKNFEKAKVTDSFRVLDEETWAMISYLSMHCGLLVGPSGGLNVAGAVKVARRLGPGKTIVTVICDSGERYRQKVLDSAWIQSMGLPSDPGHAVDDISFVL